MTANDKQICDLCNDWRLGDCRLCIFNKVMEVSNACKEKTDIEH